MVLGCTLALHFTGRKSGIVRPPRARPGTKPTPTSATSTSVESHSVSGNPSANSRLFYLIFSLYKEPCISWEVATLIRRSGSMRFFASCRSRRVMSKKILLGPMGVRELFKKWEKPKKMHYRGHFSTQNVSQFGNRSEGQLGISTAPVGPSAASNAVNRILIGPPRKKLWLFAPPKIDFFRHFFTKSPIAFFPKRVAV